MTASRARKIAAENHLKQEEMVLFGCQQQIWSCSSCSRRYSSHFGAVKAPGKGEKSVQELVKNCTGRGFLRSAESFCLFWPLKSSRRDGSAVWSFWRRLVLETDEAAESTERRVRQGPAMLIPTEEACEGYGHSGQMLLRADEKFTVVSSFRHFFPSSFFFQDLFLCAASESDKSLFQCCAFAATNYDTFEPRLLQAWL